MFIFDFDDTLFDTHRYKQARSEALCGKKVEKDIFNKTYLQARTNELGYSDDVHAYYLSKEGYDFEVVLSVFREINQKAAEFIFDDTHTVLKDLKADKHRLVLLTLGNPEHQHQSKVAPSGVLQYFDEVIFVKKNKVAEIKKDLVEKTEEVVWFINDKPLETKEIIQMYPHIKPILKVSPQFALEEYAKTGFPYFHTLTEIKNYVRSQLEQSGSGDTGSR